MAIKMSKGSRISLTKGTSLREALAGLGWDTNRYHGSDEFDLDLVLFECDDKMQCIDEKHIVFYNNKVRDTNGKWIIADPELAIKHSGDNRTGQGDGDDESAIIDFAKLNPKVENIVVVATIYDADARRQNFGMVDNAYIRIVDNESGKEIARYDLGESFSKETAVIFGELKRIAGDWDFQAVGKGAKDLEALCIDYGLEVE